MRKVFKMTKEEYITQVDEFMNVDAASAVETFGSDPMSPFVISLTVFLLAVFIGYYVVWRVTPALHSPLMAVTNAISSVIIIGALIGAGASVSLDGSSIVAALAVILASINIFGGFMVSQRMLMMFKKKK